MNNTTQTFTDLLDSCIEAVVDGRLTIADCLNRYPEHRAELAELLPLLTTLQQAGRQVAPAPAFRQAARQRLIERLEPIGPVAPPPSPSLRTRLQEWWAETTAVSPRPAFAWSLALVLILFFFIGGGTLYAANQSLPGDTLYPLNQTVEQWRLELARDEQSRFELQLAFADKRLHEAARLARRGNLAGIEEALNGYQMVMANVTQAVETADPEQQPLFASRLETATANHDASLTGLFVAVGREEDEPLADESQAMAVFCQTDSSMTHPVANQLATQYAVDYETIVAWFCQGFGFGEIGLAYNLSQQTETAVADLFALREAGYSWGQIMQQHNQLLPLLPVPDESEAGPPIQPTTPGDKPQPAPGPPEDVGPPDDRPGDPPDHVDPPGHGPPDDIGPPQTPDPWRTPPGQIEPPAGSPTPAAPGLPHGTPPGSGPPGDGPPGQGGSPPGQGSTPPGQGGTPPGQGSERP
jgi:hypothetical protein